MPIAIDLNTVKKAIGFQTLTVDSTAGGLGFTAANYRDVDGYCDATVALVTVDGTAGTNDVRVTVDGTAPVAATTGHLLKAGDCFIVRGLQNIIKFRAIREGGTSGTIQATFFN